MLVKSVTGGTTRIFKGANNLQPVKKKFLKQLCKSSLLTYFEHACHPFATQKFR